MAWSRVHRDRGRRRFAGPYGRDPRLPRVAGGAREWIICRLDWRFTDDLLTILGSPYTESSNETVQRDV
jgi:hypothetical protein